MLKKLLGMMLAVVLVVSLLPLSAFAEETDGLSIYQSADKTKYGKKDDITVTLIVRNTDHTRVDYANIQLLNETPYGYVLKAGSSAEMSIPLLKAGQEVVLTSVFHPVNIPTTGDRGIGMPLLIGGIALFCLLFLLSDKKGRFMHFFRSMMCFLLVISMAVMMLPLKALAASLTIPFSTVVKVEDKEVKLNSLVSYDPLKRMQEESLTIGDILPEDFPTTDDWTSTPEDAWIATNENRCCKANDKLYFIRKTDTGREAISVPLSTPITEDGDNYICEAITFVMSEDKLDRIVYNGDTQYKGVYVSVSYEGPMIASILPDDFPTMVEWYVLPEDAWISTNGNLCYKMWDDSLIFYHDSEWVSETDSFPLRTPITKDGDNYIFEAITFVMSDGKLERIEYNSDTTDKFNGYYTPPWSPDPPYEGPTVADILPNDFPTTDIWYLVPIDAWVAENGNRCFKENDNILYFCYGQTVAQDDNYLHATPLDLSTPVLKHGENYICDDAVFVMSGENLIRIEYNIGGETDGDYIPRPKTIGDILPKDFPATGSWSSVPEKAWVAENGNHCYKAAPGLLYFMHEDHASNLDLNMRVTKDGENYICDGAVFVMSGENVIRIEYNIGGDTDGVYAPPPTTIADILPDDFPTTDDWHSVPGKAWVADNGNRCYKENDDSIVFYYGNPGIKGHAWLIDLRVPVTEDGGNYICEYGVFVMSGEDLIRIECNMDLDTDGVYMPWYNIGAEALTVADILPDDFPTTDYWASVPEHAWVADNGNHCYKENDDALVFSHEYYDSGSYSMQATYLKLSLPITKNGENYVCDDATFVMSGENLIRIEYRFIGATDGDFEPTGRSIAHILPDDFPTTDSSISVPDNA